MSLLSRNRSTDLTQGVIWKQLVVFAIPLVLSNMMQSLYGMFDTLMMGRFVGPVGISAVNNSSMIMQLLTQVMMGVGTGGSILISQYFGAKDPDNRKQTTNTLFTFSMLFGAAFMLIFVSFARPILALLRAPALEEATRYLTVCAFGLPFIAGYNAASGAMRSVGNSRGPLTCIVTSCVMNVILNFVFIVGCGWGVFGAALSNVICQALCLGMALMIILRDYELYGLVLTKLRIYPDKLKKLLKLGIPVCVQMTVANISWLSVMYSINGYGVIASAGNGVSVKIKNFCQLSMLAVSNASSSMIGQNIGAKQYDRARKIVYAGMRITLSISILVVGIIQGFTPQIVSVFTKDPETAAVAVLNLRIEIIAQFFYACFQLYHALAIGAGHTWYVLLSSFSNCILARFVLVFILEHFMGLIGVYYACLIAPAVSIPIGIWYIRSNRWRKDPVISAKAIT